MNRSWVRENALTLLFTVLFLGALLGQALVGHADYNHDQVAHHDEPISLGTYVTSSVFWVDVMENWQSEYLQFALFALATVWLLQRGSPESKEPKQAGTETDAEQKVGRHAPAEAPPWAAAGGLRTAIFSNSLIIVMGLVFIGSWFAQSVTGWSAYNAEQLEHSQPRVDWLSYVVTPEFWEDTLQNWQSEFLAVGTMVIFSVYLRQRGSTQSKPVGAPHAETAAEG